jgi:O-antigen/teichoic acid export membrane protein
LNDEGELKPTPLDAEKQYEPSTERVKKFAVDVGWGLFGLVISLVITFLLKVFLARGLGPSGLGIFSLIMIVLEIAIIVGPFGTPIALIKYSAEHKDEREKLDQFTSCAFISSIALGVLIGILLYILSAPIARIFDKPELARLLKILALAIPFLSFLDTWQGLLNGLREMKVYAYLLILRNFLNTICIIALIELGFGIEGAVVGIVVAGVAGCLFGAFYLRRTFRLNLAHFFQNGKKLIWFGAQVCGSNAINFVANQVDVIMLGFFLPSTSVGYYSAAVSISVILGIIPEAIQKISLPVSSEYGSKNNYQTLQKILDKTMKYSASIVLPLGLGMFFFAREITTSIFGGEFISAVSPLCILLIARVIRGATIMPVGGSFSGVGRPDVPLKLDALTSVLGFGLNLLLIRRFGVAGAAMATTMSLLAGTFAGLWLLPRIVKVRIDIRWYSRAMCFSVGAIACFLLGKNFTGSIVAACFVLPGYMILFFVFLLTPEDKKLFQSLAQSLLIRR